MRRELIDADFPLTYNSSAGEVLELADRLVLGTSVLANVWVRTPPSPLPKGRKEGRQVDALKLWLR